MKRRRFFFYSVLFFTALGVASIVAFRIITDPYYSLPAIIIAIISFTIAGLSLLLRKENAWLTITFIVLLVFTVSSTGVVISKYSAEINKTTTRGGIVDDFYDLDILKLDSQTAVLKITISLSNPDIFDVRLNKISIEVTNILFSSNNESLISIGSLEWIPTETIKARNHTKISAIVTASDVKAVSYLVNAVQGSDRLLLKVKGSIWYEEKGQEYQVNIMGTAFQFF